MVTVESASASAKDWAGSRPPGAAAAAAVLRSIAAVPSPPPPPPPPLPGSLGFSSGAAASSGAEGPSGHQQRRLRNFNWEPIPAERIHGRHNLWTAGRRGGDLPLDCGLLEELFGQRSEPAGGSVRALPSAEQNSLLDAKKILNLGIFLKQFKRPVQEIVADIRDGTGVLDGAEKLTELCKMLPDGAEVQKLSSFQGDKSRLSEAEVFALLLIQVPSYARRLELLVLKQQLLPQLTALQSDIQILTEAALELLDCEELHNLIHLVLKTGNYMNEGGYAGSARGFRMSSLLRLADTKGNRPGVDLLHFVALEAERKEPSLLRFPGRLQHVGPASRIAAGEVEAELQGIEDRLSRARGELEGLGLEAQMEPFLHAAGVELRAVEAAQQSLRRTAAMLSDFLCEDLESFSLPKCCGVFHAFAERFVTAVEENRSREAASVRQRQHRGGQQEQAKQKRRSIATCSSRDPGLQDVELDLLAIWATGLGRRSRPPRAPRSFSSIPREQERPLHPSQRHPLPLLPPCPEPPGIGRFESAPGFTPTNWGKEALVTSTALPISSSPAQGPNSPNGLHFPAKRVSKGPEAPCPHPPKSSAALWGSSSG